MSNKRAPGRSLDEWMELVTECRQSGLTDAAWCNEPTSHKQDVVQIAIEPEISPAELIPNGRNSSMHLDNSHTIEIEAKGLLIRMSNTIQPTLLKVLMDALKEPLC